MYRREASNGNIKKRKHGDDEYIYFQYYDLETGKHLSVYCGVGDMGIREAEAKRFKYLDEKQRLLNEEIMKAKEKSRLRMIELDERAVQFKQEIDIAKKIRPLTGKLDDYMGSS